MMKGMGKLNKRKYVFFIIISIVIIIIISIFIIYNSKNTRNKGYSKELSNNKEVQIINTEIINEIVMETLEQTKKITPNMHLKFKKYYTKCGHVVDKIENVPENIVNITIDEFKNLYSDWKVLAETETEIILYKQIEGQCEEHYIVKNNEGYISIYQIDNNDNEVLIEKTDIVTKYLPDIDKEKLEDGVKIIGQEELISYIEDFE